MTAPDSIHAAGQPLALEEAARERWDAIVVGAGVAGCVAAARLAQADRRVLLLDRARFPRAKTCGGCLNPRAVRLLRELGFDDALVASRAVPLERVEFRLPRARPIALEYDRQSGGLAVSREALDVALVQEAQQRGARFLAETAVRASGVASDHRWVEAQRPGGPVVRLKAEAVLACDGLASRLARAEGLIRPTSKRRGPARLVGLSLVLPPEALGASALPGATLRMAVDRDGYGGLVQVEDGRWSVAVAIKAEALRTLGAGECVLRYLRQLVSAESLEAKMSQVNQLGAEIVTCPRLGVRLRRPAAERLLFCGDAAGYREPITGEGMAWAAASAEAAAEVVANGWTTDAPDRYAALWRKRVAARTRLVRLAGALAQAPRAAATLAPALHRFPALTGLLVRALERPERALTKATA